MNNTNKEMGKFGDGITKRGAYEKYLLEGKDAYTKSIASIDKLLDRYKKEDDEQPFNRRMNK